jgi:hypothetical protein
MLSRQHVVGFVVGIGAVWAYHHWVKPLPAAKES